MSWDLPPTVRSGGADDRPRSLRLVVAGPASAFVVPAPAQGELRVGRADSNQLAIDDRELSREHAVLRFGASVTLEDLGSANGTKLRGKRLAARALAELAPGDLIELGGTIIVLQSATAQASGGELCTHGGFERRLAEECARGASDRQHRFAVLRVRVGGARDSSSVEALVREALGPAGLVASYAPGELELLLVGADARAADEAAGRLEERALELGLGALAGVACFPKDGRSAEALLSCANAALAGQGEETPSLLAEDPGTRAVLEIIDRVARGPISVMLLGETGVGKEVFAAEVHARSPRRARPFVTLNSAAFSETLIESELFGHEKGAFTGADVAKVGMIESAEGGTVFLDELGEMPLPTQAKLLRVIEQRQIIRVGSTKPRPIDVRFVSATNRDLEAEVAAGRFRRDLLYRLNAVAIQIPPLRERAREIAPLARRFVGASCASLGLAAPLAIAPRAMARLESYAWPGNIRELKNVIDRAVLMCDGDTIELEHLPVEKLSASWTSEPRAALPAVEVTGDAERDRIVRVLAECGGNQTRAAERLGISRRTLTKKLTKHELPRPLKDR